MVTSPQMSGGAIEMPWCHRCGYKRRYCQWYANLSWLVNFYSVRQCRIRSHQKSPIVWPHPFFSFLHHVSRILHSSCHFTFLCAGSQFACVHLAPFPPWDRHCPHSAYWWNCWGFSSVVTDSSKFLGRIMTRLIDWFCFICSVWYLVRTPSDDFSFWVALNDQNANRAPCYYDSQGDRTCLATSAYRTWS